MLKAYSVTLEDWGLEWIMVAETRGKAISQAWYEFNQSYAVGYIDFRAKRVSQFDKLAQDQNGKHPWCIGWRDGGEKAGCLK